MIVARQHTFFLSIRFDTSHLNDLYPESDTNYINRFDALKTALNGLENNLKIVVDKLGITDIELYICATLNH